MKLKIAYIGWTEPSSGSGASLALQRHLFEDNEFEVMVATDKQFRGVGTPDTWITLERPIWYRRLCRTRLRRLLAHWEMLAEPFLFSRKIEEAVACFRPDVILTIPDNSLSWAAYMLAKKTGIPLVTNFQDWWPVVFPISDQPLPFVKKLLEERFRQMHEASRVAFCTSEGFREFLGSHPDNPVLYPCPAPRPVNRPDANSSVHGGRLRLVYGGTLVRHYGEMLLSLAKLLEGSTNFEICLYGARPDWSESDLRWAEQSGVYRGALPQEKFRRELLRADVFIAVMSHAPEMEIMSRTSFTTKFLEYCQFAKPVVVWGPDFCQPVRVARATGAGLAVTSDCPADVLASLNQLLDSVAYQNYANNAWRAATTIFDPASIQQIFREGVTRAASASNRMSLG